ncbi:hypothetical protein H6P81_016086 [Aristolochia fimbriata]|uniref:Uncharacterized protein n=1 Tax=Aristolochia fimbriata TaxID=158543 RepID=A0AAV7EA74_ARIFI|nr:hypothetical protein H6P81_016086 [Aristolochia fimbriata]
MAQQEDGWPLGLQPLNVRVGLVRNPDFSGSISFSTLLTGSPTSSTDSSSDLDTESTGSFFHDKSITLGNLIGAHSVLDLSGRSVRGPRRAEAVEGGKRSYKSKTWFSICTKACLNAESPRNGASLGHFLEVERRSATVFRRDRNSMREELDEISGLGTITESNSLFVNGRIAPPHVGSDGSMPSSLGSIIQRRNNRDFNRGQGHGHPVLLLSCICAQAAN